MSDFFCLEKLKAYAVKGDALSNIIPVKQEAGNMISGANSKPLTVNYGVPQGYLGAPACSGINKDLCT